jgi:hypothetical protein
VWRWLSPVCPFAWDAKTTACRLAKNQRIDAAYASRLEYLEALTTKGMEGMTDFRPSQMLAVAKCSSR